MEVILKYVNLKRYQNYLLTQLSLAFIFSLHANAGGTIPFGFLPLPSLAPPPPSVGYFVLGNQTYNGNLQGAAANGLAGADAKCLSELTAQDWLGKSSAGTLTQARVRAFLCNETTCQNPIPNTKYMFARVNQPTAGGAEFTSNAQGLGPGDNADWSQSSHFSTVAWEWYWTGRNYDPSTTIWPNTPTPGSNCSNWTNSASGNGTHAFPDRTDDFRWNGGADPCYHTFRLICMVDP